MRMSCWRGSTRTSALRRQQRELQENYRRLSELERLRDSLVHMVVHDLRSPLLGLSGCLQLLQADLAGKLEPEQAEDLDSALTAAQRLGEMVTFPAGCQPARSGPDAAAQAACDLRPVIAGAIESLGGLTQGRKVAFTPPDPPVSILCDAEVMGRVVANLVGNALKFTPASGEVRVTACTAEEGVKVAIADTGPGIPEEYRERIFEKFGQVEGQAEGKKHSTGLGLTFCKLAVEAHGGMIGVDSEVGQGSTFWFTLPKVDGRRYRAYLGRKSRGIEAPRALKGTRDTENDTGQDASEAGRCLSFAGRTAGLPLGV